MEIAKGITADDYNKLNLTSHKNPDWQTAFQYLDNRLTERYVDPVELLINSEKEISASQKRFGFTIMAIDCLLIETIQSFYEGVTNSHGQSQQLFKNFLTQREHFKEFFKTQVEAGDFYINFRCGILHQAQTFGDTKIWTVGQLIMRQGKYVIVNRDLFHEAVKKEKKLYLDLLCKQDNNHLLDNFKTKMDFIASS